MREIWDRIGISASVMCIAHCLATPLLVLALPAVGETLSHELFHILIVLVVVPVAVWALWNGYRLHRLPRVLWLGGTGLFILGLAMYLGQFHAHSHIEMAGMILAGALLAGAHFFNLRACRARH